MIRDRLQQSNRRCSRFRAHIETLERREVLSAMLGLTAANAIVSFDSTRPDVVRSITPITGLQPGESVLSMDSRPYTGQIFGLGSTGRLYTLDPVTGAAAIVGSGPLSTPLSGTVFDLEADPFTDTLRIVSDAGQDLRVNPDTAEVAIDPNLAYATGDAGAGSAPAVVGAAYSNNVPGGFTLLFEIDAKRGVLVTQGKSPSGGTPPTEDSGQLFTVGSLGIPISGRVGFEIPAGGPALAAISTPGGATTTLYQINTSNGSASPVGAFPSSVAIRDITSMPRVETVRAVTAANHLISFRSTTPGTLLSDQPILGLQLGETVQSIDFRPATGQLYGIGSTGRLYVLNTSTAAATPVSSIPINPLPSGPRYSIEFEPTTDRIRLVSTSGQDLRINPDTAAVESIDPTLAYAPTDPASSLPPSVAVEGSLYRPPGSAGATLFGIDTLHNSLIIQGGRGGVLPSPDAGQLLTVGSLGRDVTDDAGLDLTTNGFALASLTSNGASSTDLFVLNTSTARLTRTGSIGGGSIVRDMAIDPEGFAQFTTSSFTALSTSNSATIIVTRMAGSSGVARVNYASSDGTARAGVDYLAVSGTLEFADGEVTKSISVPLIPGSFDAGNRTINVQLSPISGNILIGSIASTVLTIQSLGLPSTPGIASTTFRGGATSISAVDVTFGSLIDPAIASNPANYVVDGQTSGRHSTTRTLAILSVSFDLTSSTAHVVFDRSFPFSAFKSLRVRVRGAGSGGSDVVVTYTVLRGGSVSYLDGDGDRVILGAIGRRSKIVVLRRADGATSSAWVEGNARSIYGLLIPRRGSNRKATIDRLVTNGARLRLARSISVTRTLNHD